MAEIFEERMRRAGIRDADLEETFARSAGPGGQNVNKVATAVTLRHRPSGTSVTVQDSRSQAMNRKLARERLLTAIEREQHNARAARKASREKVRRQNSPRPRGLKRRILETKRKRSTLKKLRGNVAE
jgi:peptide chain release factor